jgi:hypothetical protein
MLISSVLLWVPLASMAGAARFDIDRQPLSAALKTFADQSHMQLLYQYDTVAGFTANALTGELETHVALESLLRHSGLQVIYSSDTAATIIPPQNPDARHRAPAPAAAAAVGSNTPLPEVTIEGELQINKRVHVFVSEALRVVASQASPPSLARWNQPICLLVSGVSADHSAVILARVTQAAAAVGVKIQPAPCRVNLYIVATDEPDVLLRSLHKRAPGLFGEESPAAVERFFQTPRPVRVWYNTQFVGKYGNRLHSVDLGRAANHPLVHNNLAEMSPLEFDDVRHIFAVIETVDVARIAGVDIGRLADYLAMTGLAEINLDANLGAAPTILRTFDALGAPVSAPEAPAELTAWDRGLLHGLYVTAQSSKMQRSLIEDVMLRDLAHQGTPGE